MTKEEKYRLELEKKDIFTPRQVELFEKVLEGSPVKYKKIGKDMGIEPSVAKQLVSGKVGDSNKTRRGILGNIEKEIGVRPYDMTDAIYQSLKSGIVRIEKNE